MTGRQPIRRPLSTSVNRYSLAKHISTMDHVASAPPVYRVTQAMNKRGVLTLTTPTAERHFQVVTYQDESLRQQLAQATTGSIVHVRVRRTKGRACVYRATRRTATGAAAIRPTRSSQGLPVASWPASNTAMTGSVQRNGESDAGDATASQQPIDTHGENDD